RLDPRPANRLEVPAGRCRGDRYACRAVPQRAASRATSLPQERLPVVRPRGSRRPPLPDDGVRGRGGSVLVSAAARAGGGRRVGRMPPDKAVQIARQLCAGIAAAHEKGVLHRDLKPANVMLDGNGDVRISDFGIATLGGGAREGVVGTPQYMAPELLAGHATTSKSDIYALGLILFEIFTGKRAYEA